MVFWFSQHAHLYNICPQWKRKQLTDLFLCFVKYKSTRKKDLIIDAILKLSSTRAARVFNIRWGDMLASRGQKCWLESKEQTVLFCLSIPKHAFCYHRDKNTYLWHFMRWNFWPRRASDSGRRVEVAQCPSRTRLHNRFLPTSAPVYVLICRDFSFKK